MLPVLKSGLLVAMMLGCSAPREIPPWEMLLRRAPSIELLSLDPTDPTLQTVETSERLQDWNVLGKVVIQDAATRTRLIDSLVAGIQDQGTPVACFFPRHALRVNDGMDLHEFVVCFQCDRMLVTSPGRSVESVPVNKSPQRVWDKILRDAQVPLSTVGQSK